MCLSWVKSCGRSSAGFSRFFINIGKKDGVKPVNIIGLINDNLRNKGAEIGKIDILASYSFFEVEKSFESDILRKFKNADFNGRDVSVELSEEKSPKNRDDKPKTHRKNRRRG